MKKRVYVFFKRFFDDLKLDTRMKMLNYVLILTRSRRVRLLLIHDRMITEQSVLYLLYVIKSE